MVRTAPSQSAASPFDPPKSKRSTQLLNCPFTVSIEQREQARWMFTNIHAGCKQHYRPLLIQTEIVHMKTGDYSIMGNHHLYTIERKSLADLYHTLGQGRENFEEEHKRMAEMIRAGGFAAVVIEAPLLIHETEWWGETLCNPDESSKLNPASLLATMYAWMVRYQVPWIWAGDKRRAELTCFRLLEKCWDKIVHEAARNEQAKKESSAQQQLIPVSSQLEF